MSINIVNETINLIVNDFVKNKQIKQIKNENEN